MAKLALPVEVMPAVLPLVDELFWKLPEQLHALRQVVFIPIVVFSRPVISGSAIDEAMKTAAGQHASHTSYGNNKQIQHSFGALIGYQLKRVTIPGVEEKVSREQLEQDARQAPHVRARVVPHTRDDLPGKIRKQPSDVAYTLFDMRGKSEQHVNSGA